MVFVTIVGDSKEFLLLRTQMSSKVLLNVEKYVLYSFFMHYKVFLSDSNH